MKKLILILLFVILLCTFTSARREISCNIDNCTELRGLWHLNGTALDASGNGNHGTVNGASATTGFFDSGYAFNSYDDGDDADHIDMGTDESLNISGPMTISAWFYSTQFLEDTVYPVIASKMSGDTWNHYGWELYLENSGGYNGYYEEVNGSLPEYQYSDFSGYSIDSWNHIAVVASGDNRYVYINGDLVNTVDFTRGMSYSATSPFWVGNLYNSGSSYNEWNGTLDEIATWARALSEDEIKILYNIGYTPLARDSNFSLQYGSTDFESVNLTAIDNMILAVSGANVTWDNQVDAKGDDYDSNVILYPDFVSINTDSLDNSIDTTANVTLTVADCGDYTIYYAPVFYNNFDDIKYYGYTCNEGSAVACTDISCTDGVLTFSVAHFDSYGAGPGNDLGGAESGPVPEFSTWAMTIALLGVCVGFYFIRKE